MNCATAIMDTNHLKITGKRKRKINSTYEEVNTGDLSITFRRGYGFVQLSKENVKNSDGVRRFKKSINDMRLSKLF